MARTDEQEAQTWHGLYWRAFDALRFDRQYGSMGEQSPISYQAIRCFAADNGITGMDFEMFRQCLTAVDDEWLIYVSEKLKEREQSGPAA